ncbi:MAG: S8 family serine peptidase [Polyangiaceae bacterium]|nr:S8 family serine peptidase [Polyangiaceae bacterium]
MRLSRSFLVAVLALAACQATPLPDDAEWSRSSQAIDRSAPGAQPIATTPGPIDPGQVVQQVRKAVRPIQSPQLVHVPGGGIENPRTTLLAPPPGFTSREVVGVVPGGESCPADNAHWDGGDVFGSTFVPGPSGQRFCSYRWIGAGPPNIDLLPKYCPSGKNCESCPTGWTCEPAPTGDEWLEPGHHGVVAAGLPRDARAVISNQIKKQHAAAIGSPTILPFGSAPSRGSYSYSLPQRSRVFILDDDGLHGDTVENWIRQTACPDGSNCPLITRRNVYEAGDDVGSAIKLAQEIVKAANEGSGWNPIINLSLGFYWKHAWTAKPNSNDDVAGANLRFAHSALEAAINYAGWKGAIVVAAAGNRDGGSEAEEAGPRYFGGSAALPAALSRMGRRWTCTASPSPVNETLLIPVSSIRADGSVARSAREHGKSCIRAPSMALTAEGDPLEGSSFAAATVSAILANAKSYMVGATRMELIYAVLSHMQALAGPLDHRVCHSGVEHQDGRVQGLRVRARAAAQLPRHRHGCRSPQHGRRRR